MHKQTYLTITHFEAPLLVYVFFYLNLGLMAVESFEQSAFGELQGMHPI